MVVSPSSGPNVDLVLNTTLCRRLVEAFPAESASEVIDVPGYTALSALSDRSGYLDFPASFSAYRLAPPVFRSPLLHEINLAHAPFLRRLESWTDLRCHASPRTATALAKWCAQLGPAGCMGIRSFKGDLAVRVNAWVTENIGPTNGADSTSSLWLPSGLTLYVLQASRA